jgi:Tol biopolymer transport system component
MLRTWPGRLVMTVVALSTCFMAVWPQGAAGAAPAGAAQVVLRQTTLGPMPTDTREISISPDGSRVALVSNAGTRQRVFIDGVEGPQYSSIAQVAGLSQGPIGPRLVMISPDLTRVAYAATRGPSAWMMVVNHQEGPVFDGIKSAAFSPVGHRLAYIGTKGGKQYVVVDSTISPGYQIVGQSEFSADGQHFGYTASTGPGAKGWRAVIDGKEGPGFVNVPSLEFSKQGGHHAYIAQPANSVEENYLVVDGKMGPKFALIQSVTFSDDGRHFAYIAAKPRDRNVLGVKWVAVIDGQVGPEFEEVSGLAMCADGGHTIYAGKETRGRIVSYAIVDGKKSLDYAACHSFVFSPDGQHLAYVATAANGASVVVLDERESNAHQSIAPASLRFSADGKRLAYVVNDPDGWRCVVDGKAGPLCRAIDTRTFAFSPDGGHFRYQASLISSEVVIADNAPPNAVPGQPAPMEVVASPDGQHTATRMVKDSGTSQATEQVLLDGKPVGETYARVAQLQISPDGKHVAFIANFPVDTGKKQTYAVLDGREGPGFFRIDHLLLSPDGQHIAYAATEDGTKQQVVVDSFAGPVYEQVFLGITQRFEAMQFRADGSLEFLAVMDQKLNRMVLGGDALRSLPAPAAGAPPAASPGYSQIHAFGKVENDGAKPAVLAAAPDGTLFGATTAGGEFMKGVLFRLKPDGSEYKVLRSFEGGQGDGAYPGSLWIGKDGAVYGSLNNEGPNSYGAIYRAAADGSAYTILRPFTGNKDGGAPVLHAVDDDGTLYGLSYRDRTPLHLFRMKREGGEFQTIYSAPQTPGPSDAGVGPFVDGGDGFFYGTANLYIFKIKKDGTGHAVVRKFAGPPRDISNADRAPILGADGVLYGISSNGGAIYKINRDGTGYALIVKNDVLGPRTLAEGTDGKLYGLVEQGLISVQKDGGGFTVLKEMKGGFFPWSAVVHQGAFYGMSAEGLKGGFVFRYGIGGGAAGEAGGATAAPALVLQVVPPAPLDSKVEIPAAGPQ